MGRLLLALTVMALLWTMTLVVTGGVDLRGMGIRFSSRDPFRPACVAAVLVLLYAAIFRADARARLFALRAAVEGWGPLLVVVVSLYVLGLAVRFGSHVAGGSDPYGYVSQADLWLAGTLTVPQPVAREMPWDLADWTFAPLGYRPAVSGGAIVPTYPPGLSLLMALAKWAVGECGPYLVVPLFGALLVWLTYRLGVHLASRSVGVAAAVLLAASPVFVSQALRPMSDVPIAALLLAAVVILLSDVRLRVSDAQPAPAQPGPAFAVHVGPSSPPSRTASPKTGSIAIVPAGGSGVRCFWTGVILSLALLVRPNLAPLALIFVVYAWMRARTWRDRLARTALLAAGLLPGVLAVAAIHTHLYGAPWKSGYGDLGTLYAWRHLSVNLARYPRWLIETQTPLIIACVLPLLAWRSASAAIATRIAMAPVVWFLGVLIAAIWASYLFYLPFDDWGYLRFVLASFPLMLVLAVMGWQLAASRLRWESRAAILLALLVVVLGYEVGRVQNLVILGRWRGECGEIGVAEFVGRALPPDAVIVSMHYSGTLRHYAHRLTLRYDWLEPRWWPRALSVLDAKGHRPYIVLAAWEEAEFRRRFGLSSAPGTVIAELGQPAQARIYDPLATSDAAAVPVRPPALIPAGAPCPCMRRLVNP